MFCELLSGMMLVYVVTTIILGLLFFRSETSETEILGNKLSNIEFYSNIYWLQLNE